MDGISPGSPLDSPGKNTGVGCHCLLQNKCEYVLYHFNAHFLLYIFLLLTYYLLFILHLFWTIEMMLDKKKIWLIFYSSSKLVIKQQRQLATSITHLAKALVMNVWCSDGSRSFTSELRVLMMKSAMADYWKLTKTNWEDHQCWSSYNYTRNWWRTWHQPFYSCSAFEAIRKGEKAR